MRNRIKCWCGEEFSSVEDYCTHLNRRHNVPAGEADILERSLEKEKTLHKS